MGKINVIGAGIAGLSAAIRLAQAGAGCRLISLQPSERSQSVLAEGGFNAAMNVMGENDTPGEHFADTMKGGVFMADPNAVAGMTEAAPGLVRWLLELGVPFQMEKGKLVQRNFGGQKKKRTAYARSSTGKILVNALIDETRKYEAKGLVERLNHHEFLRLSLKGDDCRGVWVRDDYTGKKEYLPGPAILCFGGFGGLFPGLATGTVVNTGDALASVFAQGVSLGNPEYLQYHPTTVGVTGKRLLVSEAARGEGGRLFIRRNGQNWYFMEELYPELGNLMPRDVISREMVKVSRDPSCEDQVYLDLTGLSEEIWRRRLPDMRQEIIRYLGIDPARTPVPVSPGIHYCMGGLLVDEEHRTNKGFLYAAGECACQYHGANRLGGNSMLGALYGGRKAAETALAALKNYTAGPMTAEETLHEENFSPVSPGFAKRLGETLAEGLAIVRDGERLAKACALVEKMEEEATSAPERRRCMLGRALLLGALGRKESRGAHWRTDYPDRDDAHFQKTTVVTLRDKEIVVEFRDIPADRRKEKA